MRVRLTRKLAQQIDEIDLSNHEVGNVMDLPEAKGRILIAEGWAIVEHRIEPRGVGPSRVLAFRRSGDLGHHNDEEDVSRVS